MANEDINGAGIALGPYHDFRTPQEIREEQERAKRKQDAAAKREEELLNKPTPFLDAIGRIMDKVKSKKKKQTEQTKQIQKEANQR